MPSNDARRNLRSKASIESFRDALWLGIRPFWRFTLQFHRNTRRCLQTMHGTICSRSIPPRASETPCGSVFGHFCVSSWNRVPALVPVAHCPLPIVWPGGMRGAIEPAALAVWQGAGVSNPKHKSVIANLTSADL